MQLLPLKDDKDDKSINNLDNYLIDNKEDYYDYEQEILNLGKISWGHYILNNI